LDGELGLHPGQITTPRRNEFGRDPRRCAHGEPIATLNWLICDGLSRLSAAAP